MAATLKDLAGQLDTIVGNQVAQKVKASSPAADPYAGMNTLYNDVLGRNYNVRPNEQSTTSYTDLLNAYNQMGADKFKANLQASPEAQVYGAWTQFLGRKPHAGEEGYWNAVAALEQNPQANVVQGIKGSPEAKAYSTKQNINTKVGLAIDPQLQSLAQQRDAYVQSMKEADRKLQEQYGSRRSAYDLSKTQNEEDITAGIQDMLNRGATLLSSRGALYSGLTDESTDRTMAAKALALGRIGQQYQADVGNLDTSYFGGQRNLAERLGLAEKQYGENVAGLQARREQLSDAYFQQQDQNQMTKDQANIQTLLTLLNQKEAGRQYDANLNFQGQQVGVVPDLGTATPGLTLDQINALLQSLYGYVGAIGA